MTTLSRRVGRRMQHTRQLLQYAFIEVAHEKGIAATTVKDITERADLNRGTFYLHFEDKYVLLQTIIHEHFQHLLTRTLTPRPQWNRNSLQRFIQAVLEDFARKYRHLLRSGTGASLMERATCEALARLLLLWLKQDQSIGKSRCVYTKECFEGVRLENHLRRRRRSAFVMHDTWLCPWSIEK